MHSVSICTKPVSLKMAFRGDTVQFMRYPGGSHRRHQRRLEGEESQALIQHLYEAGNAKDDLQEMCLSSSHSTWGGINSGKNDGSQASRGVKSHTYEVGKAEDGFPGDEKVQSVQYQPVQNRGTEPMST